MPRLLLAALLVFLSTLSLQAQEKEGYFDFGNDSFRAGPTALFDLEGKDDIFMAGNVVRVEKSITGSAHLAGRKVFLPQAVGGDLYAMGMELDLSGTIAGDANIFGYSVKLGKVGGDMRVTVSSLELSGPVAGYAIIAADEVEITGNIAGDVSLTAREIDFSEGARIGGTLTLYQQDGTALDIPASVIAAEQIKRRPISEWSEAAEEIDVWSWQQAVGQFLKGVLIVTALAALAAAFAPDRLADLRRSLLDRPFRNLLIGFLAVSSLIGASILLMMTLIGLLLVPVTVISAILAGMAGYVVGAYAVGVWITLLAGQSEPDSLGSRALAAVIGALSVALIGLIPFFGWLFVLALSLAGAGAIAVWLFRPRFFSPAY